MKIKVWILATEYDGEVGASIHASREAACNEGFDFIESDIERANFDIDDDLPIDFMEAVEWMEANGYEIRGSVSLEEHELDVPWPTAEGSSAQIALAIEHLKQARDLLKEAGATRTLTRVRYALTSADGAMRHAQGMASRSAA